MTSRPSHCLNCDEPLEGRFCAYCGQVASMERLTLTGLAREVWLKFTNTEDGLPHLLRELFRHPARVCRHMLEGKRKRYSNPLSFVLLTAGLSSALNYWACTRGGTLAAEAPATIDAYQWQFIGFMNQWFNVILFCSIPVNALLSYWLYKRHGYNYAEHLMLNGLLRGASLLLFCAFTPLLRWYGDLWFTWIGIYFVLWIGYFTFTYMGFFRTRGVSGIVRALLGPVLTILLVNSAMWLLFGIFHFRFFTSS
ncbi:MAG: DUF3667 domain-containing protein [Flavobacteriales bacterium]|nr:DUF3667 domain-containing protein [Flavobacteriales bacterium]